MFSSRGGKELDCSFVGWLVIDDAPTGTPELEDAIRILVYVGLFLSTLKFVDSSFCGLVYLTSDKMLIINPISTIIIV